MHSQRRRQGGLSNDVCLIILTVLVVISLFFFVLVLSHESLGSGDAHANKLIKWTENLVEVGKRDIIELERLVVPNAGNFHTAHPIAPPTTAPEGRKYSVGNVQLPTQKQQHNPQPQQPPTVSVILPGRSQATSTAAAAPFHQLTCPDGDLLSFWKRTTDADRAYVTPFANSGREEKYVTFEPDVGGWNNIRMQMELVLVFAYATGRTLVLPPDQPMYLLDKGKKHQKAHSFADFFPFDYINQRMKVISMEEFMQREAVTGQLRNTSTGEVEYPPGNKTVFDGTERTERLAMWDYLRSVGSCPTWKALTEFVVIPVAPGVNVSHYPPERAKPYAEKRTIFAAGRTARYYDEYWQSQRLVHFISKPGLGYRLLEHFYTFIHFEDDHMDRYYKRFVRDYVHYIDVIFCKAAKIVRKLLTEGKGSYSSFHVRRGEFQYKEVKIPAANMLANVGQFIPKGQLLFIATDERNKSFFDAFHTRFPRIRYLDDFMDYAELRDINPNFLGMIDQVVCTRGEIFVGTWFSTFTGYITRMRGYMGYSDKTVYFGDKAHRDRYQKPELPKFPFYMREWNTSWYQIDEV